MLNWESLQTACLSCTSCPLSQTRHNVVFGVGPQDAEVMFVGEGPEICAPMAFRKFARSTMCGSLAQFSMIVMPLHKTAASRMFIVAPTETISR